LGEKKNLENSLGKSFFAYAIFVVCSFNYEPFFSLSLWVFYDLFVRRKFNFPSLLAFLGFS
jgi:hypothetical protein